MDYIDNFIEILSELMQEKDINAKQLANAIGISNTSVSKWLSKKKTVSLKHILLLCNYFNCSIDYLIGRSNNFLPYTPKNVIPFSKQLKQIFLHKGITRYRFIKETRFTEGHIYKWDKGAVPQLSTLIELADIFDCSVDYLIGRSDIQ